MEKMLPAELIIKALDLSALRIYKETDLIVGNLRGDKVTHIPVQRSPVTGPFDSYLCIRVLLPILSAA
jgi:hypothetical protein